MNNIFFISLLCIHLIDSATVKEILKFPFESRHQLNSFVKPDCKQGQWACKNGWCIQDGYRCDGDDNCGDRSDEDDVACNRCHDRQFWSCANKVVCIPLSFLCDGIDNCGDNSDEDSTRCNRETIVRLITNEGEAKESNGTLAGVVEVRRKGLWGTICDNNWDHRDATVICRMLGYEGPAIPYHHSHFTTSLKPLWVDDVACAGTEANIDKCKADWFFHHLSCTSQREAGVECIRRQKINSGCGHKFVQFPPSDARIINGIHAVHGELPWQAEVLIDTDGITEHMCGGTIMDEYNVISAAHCFPITNASVWKVRVGNLKNDQETDLEEQFFEVKEVILHENYGVPQNMDNDIALLKLLPNNNHGIIYGDYVQPACLPEPHSELNISTFCLVSGWGDTIMNARNGSADLNEVLIPIISTQYCSSHEIYDIGLTENMICGGLIEGGVDSCQGDSGGPFVCEMEGKFVLSGVVSWGIGCALPHLPGVYTKVSNYISWLKEKSA